MTNSSRISEFLRWIRSLATGHFARHQKIWNPEWWLIVYAGIAIGILVASGTQIFTWKLENTENTVSEHRPPAFEKIKWPRYPDDLP